MVGIYLTEMKIKRLTKEQAIIISAFTGVLCCDFSDLHDAIEKKISHPVYVHELGDKNMAKRIKEAFREDFLSLLPVGEKS